MAEGTEVGRIYIRVSPDTDEFRRELKAKLEAIERELEGEIPFEGDTTEAEADAKRAAENAPKGTIKYDSKVEQLDPKQVEDAKKGVDDELEFKANLDRFRRRYLNKFKSLMTEFEANIPLTVDNESLRKGLVDTEKAFFEKLKLLDPKADQDTLAELRREIEQFYSDTRQMGYKNNLLTKEIKAQAKNPFDLSDFRKELAEEKRKFDADFAKFKNMEFFTKLGQQKLEITLRPLIELGPDPFKGRPVRLPVEIDWDRNRFTREIAVVGGGLAKSVANGFYSIGSAAAGGIRAFARLSENGKILVAVLALIPAALALVSGALVALPAAAAAVLVPIAAIALGMDGLKKAAEVLKPEFEQLKKVMSDTFEQNFTPILESFKGGFADMLTRSLPNVADGLADFAGGIRDSLTSAQGMSQIENTIDNIGAAFGRAKEGARDFTAGLLQLVSELSNKFPGLADAFNRTGKSFLEWVDKITTKDAVTGVSQLDTAMTILGDTLSRLGGLATTFFKSGWDNLSNVDFGDKMSGFVESVDRLVNVTLPQLATAFEGIATALRPAVVMVETIDRILSGLKAKLPSGDDIGAALGGDASPNKLLFGDLLGGGLDNLLGNEWSDKARAEAAKVGGDAGKKFQESLTQAAANASAGGASLTDAINKQLASGVDVNNDLQKQALQSAFSGTGVTDAVAGQIETQMGAVISRAQAAVKELGPTLQADIDAALLPLQDIPAKMMPAFEGIGAAIGGAWGGITAFIRTATGEMGNIIAQEFMNIPAKLMPAIAGFGAAVGGAVGAIKGFIANAGFADAFGQAFAGVPGRVTAALSGVPGAVAAAMTPAIGVVQAVMEGIINLVNVVGGQVAAVASATFAQFPPAVQGAMAPAIEAVGSIGQQMVSTALSFGGAMESAGRSIGASFAAGIASSSGLVAGAASALMAAARAFIPSSPADKGPFSGRGWVTYSGESVGEGFAKGMENSTGDVVSTARELMQAVKDIFGSAEGLTLNFNMGPVTQQAEAATASVKSFGDTLAAVPTAPLDDLARVQGTGVSAADSKASRDELSRQLDLLEMERKQLELQKGQVGANQAAIKARLEEIKQQKLQLGLQKDQLEYASKYGEQTEESGGKIDQFYRDMGEKIFKMPTDFARSVGSQFMNDLGISGQGAIPQLLEQGSQFIFQVANMDTALSAQQTLQRRQGMGLVGR